MRARRNAKTKVIKNTHSVKQVLNCTSMLKLIQFELKDPQERKRCLNTSIKIHFARNSKIKSIHLEDMVKIFQVNWINAWWTDPLQKHTLMVM